MATLPAEALLATTGIFQEKPISAAQGQEAESLPNRWRRSVKEWLDAEKPAKFRMYEQPAYEPTLEKLTAGIDPETSATLVSKLVNPELAQAYLTQLSNAR